MKRTALIVTIAVISTIASASLEKNKTIYENGIQKIEANTTAKDNLDKAYLNGLNKLINQYKNKADFEAVKALMAEQTRFTLEKSAGEEITYCKDIQTQYKDQLEQLEILKYKEKLQFSQRYLASLKNLLVSAMNDGQMDEAEKINAEAKKVEFIIADLNTKIPKEKLTHPSSAKKFGNHYYMYFPKEVSWQKAKQECEDMGGYLVCISSKAENDFVYKLDKSKGVWLGGSDAVSEGKWEWVSGEPFDYKNWHTGQPDNAHSREHYLHLMTEGGSAKWNDCPSSKQNGGKAYVCEWDE